MKHKQKPKKGVKAAKEKKEKAYKRQVFDDLYRQGHQTMLKK